MKQEQLKVALCGYLPYGVKCQYNGIINGKEISKYQKLQQKEWDVFSSEYDKWLEEESKFSTLPIAKQGEKLFQIKACSGCHSVADASVKVGPTLFQRFGAQEDFADGTKVTYKTTGTAIGGLVNNTDYYIRVFDANFVGLSSIANDAIDRTDTDGLIALSPGGTGTHSFTTNSVKGFLTGSGTIGFTSISNIITGTNTKFFTDLSNGDLFRIYKLNAGTVPGTYFESKITSVKSDSILKLEDNPSFTNASSNYFVPTRLYVISDGKATRRTTFNYHENM
jgi:hypothetical protein